MRAARSWEVVVRLVRARKTRSAAAAAGAAGGVAGERGAAARARARRAYARGSIELEEFERRVEQSLRPRVPPPAVRRTIKVGARAERGAAGGRWRVWALAGPPPLPSVDGACAG